MLFPRFMLNPSNHLKTDLPKLEKNNLRPIYPLYLQRKLFVSIRFYFDQQSHTDFRVLYNLCSIMLEVLPMSTFQILPQNVQLTVCLMVATLNPRSRLSLPNCSTHRHTKLNSTNSVLIHLPFNKSSVTCISNTFTVFCNNLPSN